MTYAFIEDDAERRETARHEARRLLARRPWIVDTETTGVGYDDVVCEIAVVDSETGMVVYQSLVHPQRDIPYEATAIHGIIGDMVADAPAFPLVLASLTGLARQWRPAITSFNWDFDQRLIEQSAQHSGGKEELRRFVELLDAPASCLMEIYSLWNGKWSERHGNYAWQKLEVAAGEFGVVNPHPHRAYGDAMTALNVLRCMASVG